jgi:hypothetical protein
VAEPVPPTVPLDRSTLATVPWKRIHRARSLTQATIWSLEWNGQRIAVKDFGKSRSWLARRVIGPWTIRKEARIHRLLERDGETFAGAPRMFGVIEGPALLMERMPVKRLPKMKTGTVPAEFFDALDRLLAEMHARGVAHGDLRRKNIVLDEHGAPRLIDFTTAVACPPRSLWPRTALFRMMTKVDRIAALKMRLSFFPETPLTDEQRALLENRPFPLRVGQFYRQRLYRPFKKKVLRR